MADTVNLSDKYNTPLTPEEKSKYLEWLKSKDIKPATASYDYDMQGAFKAGVAQSENGHFPDTFKKPNHPTFSDQSQYNGVDGFTGGQWIPGANGTFVFNASQTNLQNLGAAGLVNYFKEREPGNTVNLPIDLANLVEQKSAGSLDWLKQLLP